MKPTPLRALIEARYARCESAYFRDPSPANRAAWYAAMDARAAHGAWRGAVRVDAYHARQRELAEDARGAWRGARG